jgi:hypothetical protein
MRKNETVQTIKPNRREFLKLGGLATAAVIGQTALPTVARAASETLSNPATAGLSPINIFPFAFLASWRFNMRT